MSRIVFDAPAWWRQPGWQVASAVVCSLVALVVWWTALAPADHEPVVVRAPAAPPPAPLSIVPAAPPTQPLSAPLAAAPSLPATPSPPVPAPLSTMVAPGVHVTPLSVSPGVVPVPAGPSPSDTEPEN